MNLHTWHALKHPKRVCGTLSFTKKKSLRMFRFRVRKIPGPLLKFTQKTVLFQDISIFFVLKTELYLSSWTYFFFWKLVFHFTNCFSIYSNGKSRSGFHLLFSFLRKLKEPCNRTSGSFPPLADRLWPMLTKPGTRRRPHACGHMLPWAEKFSARLVLLNPPILRNTKP